MKLSLKPFVLLSILVGYTGQAAINLSSLEDLKNRTNSELRRFTEFTGMTSKFRSLSPASPLGILGFDAGIELTTIPTDAFQVFDEKIDVPPAFPRLSLAKGITPNLDIEVSALVPAVLGNQINLPEELKELLVYGGGFKYTMLREKGLVPFSLALRASYTRLNLSFFHLDTYSGDFSVSRSLSLPLLPVSITPFAGLGYVNINGEFKDENLDLIKASKTHQIQDYRYFAGASLKLFIFDVTGQADFGNPADANTYSLKIGLEL